MRCLSIRQPWAWSIVESTKRVENRTWSTAYRGPILIHAAKGMTQNEYQEFSEFYEYEIATIGPPYPPDLPPMADLQRGGIVGSAEIVDCVHKDHVGNFGRFPPERNRALQASISPWFFGPWGIVLDKVKPLPFIPYKGALGLFEVPDITITA